MGILVRLILLLSFINLEARPISYSGGSTAMLITDNMKDSVYYHYSPTYKYSVGIETVKDLIFDQEYSYLRFTYLMNRKNTRHSQRNLYFQSGISSKGRDNVFYGIHGDWETRRVFTGFGFKEVENTTQDYQDYFLQAGIAPYIGEYGDLHTWLMLKSKKNTLTNEWQTYPVLKFFKGDFLIEFGYDNKINWDVHMMYRF
jgi:hypothetical protein